MPSTPASSSAAFQLAEPAQRRAVAQRVVGHLLQEPRIGPRTRRDFGAQVVGESRLAPQRAKVEEDVGGEQAVGIAAVDPVCERRLPLRQARAPPRVRRHDAALAQRVAAAVHRLVDVAREREKALADRVRRGVSVAGREDQTVVLVGGDRLLGAALRSHPEPAQRDALEVEPQREQLEDADRELVVQARDHPRQVPGGGTLRDQRMRQCADVAGAVDEGVDVAGAADRRRELAHREPLQAEEVALRHHAGDASALVENHDVADAALRHHERRVTGGSAGRQRDDRSAHHFADRSAERSLRENDAADHVLASEDTERLRVLVDDRHRADPMLLHRREGVADGRVRPAGHRRDPRQRPERRRESALLGHRRRVLGLQPRPRQVEQVRESPRAEILEDGRRGDQRVEHGGRELEAERVSRRAVHARHAAVPEQGTQRKHLARRELEERGHTADVAWALTADRALADDVAMRGPLGSRHQDRLAGSEVTQARAPDDVSEVALAHRRERRVGHERLLEAGED